MPLETATYLNQLVATNPVHTDQVSAADSHMRLLKSVLQATFPNITGAVTGTQAQLNALSGATYPFTSASLAAGSVGSSQLAAGAVNTAALADANVTYAKIQSVANGRFLGNFSGVAAAPSEYSIGQGLSVAAGALGIANGAITYSLIQNVNTARLLGRSTAGAGVVEELTVGSGLSLSGGVLSNNMAPPPPAVFKNLSIKVATNTTVTCAADYITVSDGTNFKTLAFSGTVNLGTAGALNALDSGVIAANTWYAIWAIAKADGSLPGFLASSSFTAPTLPTGYTLSARVGAVKTASASANLMGTWQLGREAQYIVGLAQTTVPPLAASGNSGSPGTPTYTAVDVSPYVPTTASRISVAVYSSGTGRAVVAPNANYGTYSASNGPPIVNGAASAAGGAVCVIPGILTLESTNIYYACDAGTAGVRVQGWEDNI